MRFLITAGNTREKIDQVRDWGNIFTGNTGFAIARALAELGEVDLLTSNRAHIAEAHQLLTAHPIRAIPFTTHAQLRESLALHLAEHEYHAVFMTAAVADYLPQRVYAVVERSPDPSSPGEELWRVRDVQADKVKSTHEQIAVLGRQTEKLVDLFRGEWGFGGLLVKFKLEVGLSRERLIEVGQASRRASGAEYLVANTLEMLDGPSAGAYLLSDSGAAFVPRAELPQRLARLIKELPR